MAWSQGGRGGQPLSEGRIPGEWLTAGPAGGGWAGNMSPSQVTGMWFHVTDLGEGEGHPKELEEGM